MLSYPELEEPSVAPEQNQAAEDKRRPVDAQDSLFIKSVVVPRDLFDDRLFFYVVFLVQRRGADGTVGPMKRGDSCGHCCDDIPALMRGDWPSFVFQLFGQTVADPSRDALACEAIKNAKKFELRFVLRKGQSAHCWNRIRLETPHDVAQDPNWQTRAIKGWEKFVRHFQCQQACDESGTAAHVRTATWAQPNVPSIGWRPRGNSYSVGHGHRR